MKYQELRGVARQIDHLIDHNLPPKTAGFISQSTLESLVTQSFPDFYVIAHGWHKTVFGTRSQDHRVVLKVGPQKSIENDHRAYRQVPHSLRHHLFARIFWHTKYCLLQEYGAPADITSQQLKELRDIVNRYGIFDVKADNLRVIGGEVKIIDANVTRLRLSRLLRVADEVKARFPQKLQLWIKKATRQLHDR
ncbi:MAG: hypothetical protein NWE93_02505 [Candidatus Bathyarchaeota archaeon]|nr:hypothetical protein [Candidatus Bathyarchaeota archaeon]